MTFWQDLHTVVPALHLAALPSHIPDTLCRDVSYLSGCFFPRAWAVSPLLTFCDWECPRPCPGLLHQSEHPSSMTSSSSVASGPLLSLDSLSPALKSSLTYLPGFLIASPVKTGPEKNSSIPCTYLHKVHPHLSASPLQTAHRLSAIICFAAPAQHQAHQRHAIDLAPSSSLSPPPIHQGGVWPHSHGRLPNTGYLSRFSLPPTLPSPFSTQLPEQYLYASVYTPLARR